MFRKTCFKQLEQLTVAFLHLQKPGEIEKNTWVVRRVLKSCSKGSFRSAKISSHGRFDACAVEVSIRRSHLPNEKKRANYRR